MKVLVCDDEALARDRLVRLLRDAKECEVVGEAENGRDALQKVEMLAPDVILLDIRMPVMDGIACAEELARLPNPPTARLGMNPTTRRRLQRRPAATRPAGAPPTVLGHPTPTPKTPTPTTSRVTQRLVPADVAPAPSPITPVSDLERAVARQVEKQVQTLAKLLDGRARAFEEKLARLEERVGLGNQGGESARGLEARLAKIESRLPGASLGPRLTALEELCGRLESRAAGEAAPARESARPLVSSGATSEDLVEELAQSLALKEMIDRRFKALVTHLEASVIPRACLRALMSHGREANDDGAADTPGE